MSAYPMPCIVSLSAKVFHITCCFESLLTYRLSEYENSQVLGIEESFLHLFRHFFLGQWFSGKEIIFQRRLSV